MLLNLILLFAIVPILELSLLFRAAATIGGPETLLVCLVTGAIGGTLARNEGLAVWHQLRQQLTRAEAPGQAVVEAFLVFAGGLLLLTPGILTDLVGFAMVIPFTRRALASHVVKRVTESLKAGVIQAGSVGPDGVFRSVGGFSASSSGGGYQVRVVENHPAQPDSWQDTDTPGLRRLN